MESAPARDAQLERAVRLVAAVAVAASAAYFWGTNAADEDLWNHLNFGELKLRTLAVPRADRWSYSAPGHPWFNHEWGSEVVVALLYRLAGTPALLALKAAIGVAILAAILDAARTLARGARPHPALAGGVLVLVFAALAPGASFRPQLFTMLFLALELALLVRADARLFDGPAARVGWECAAVPLVVLAWTNAHGGFPVGVALHAVFVAGVLARTLAARLANERRPGARALAGVALSAAATLAATFVNPYGAALHRYLATTLDDHGRITEWLPIPLLSTSHAPFKVLVATTLACAVPWLVARTPRSARLDWRLAFVAAATVGAFRHQRHSVLATIAAAPVLLAAAEQLRRRVVARWPSLAPRPPVVAWVAAGALAIAGVQLALVTARYAEGGLGIAYERGEFPADAVAFLDAEGVRGNMAVQFEWGGYTLYHLGERARVFVDGRYEASYPAAVIDDYFAFIEGAPGWARVLDDYPTDVVVVDRMATVVRRLDARPDLVRVHTDHTAVVYLRRTAANAATIAKATALAGHAPATRRPAFFP